MQGAQDQGQNGNLELNTGNLIIETMEIIIQVQVIIQVVKTPFQEEIKMEVKELILKILGDKMTIPKIKLIILLVKK